MTRCVPMVAVSAHVCRCVMAVCIAWAALVPTTVSAQPVATEQPVLEVFVREDCPHCAAAEAFLPAFGRRRSWLRIVYRKVDADPSARDDLMRHSRNAGVWPPGVPTFVIDGKVLVGFEDAARTGPALASLVAHRAPSPSAGTAPADASGSPATRVQTRWFGALSAERFGLPLFTLAMGLLDGFNPCAMWVLLFLLSMLVHLRDRRRMALVAGTFVIASGVVYYAFMAAWLNVFLLIGFADVVRWALAGAASIMGAIHVKDFFAMGKGISLSIPDSARPGLYARVRSVVRAETVLPSLAAVAVLAVVVNFVEILCTAGLPAIYTAVLAQHGLSTAAHYGYLALYVSAYMADDSLMVATAVIALGSRRLTERAGRWLKLLSGVIMIALASVILVRPEWLR